MNALSHSKLRDGVNAVIASDLENIRHEVSGWAAVAASIDGQLAYSPPTLDCDNRTLAVALLADKAITLPHTRVLDLSTAPTSLKGISITRTIVVATDVDDTTNNNLLSVQYATTGSTLVNTSQSATLLLPAQGWCP